MSSFSEQPNVSDDYQGPLLSARPERGEVRSIDGQPFWPRKSTDDAAASKTYWTLNEAVAWLATEDMAIVSGVTDCEAYWGEG